MVLLKTLISQCNTCEVHWGPCGVHWGCYLEDIGGRGGGYSEHIEGCSIHCKAIIIPCVAILITLGIGLYVGGNQSTLF